MLTFNSDFLLFSMMLLPILPRTPLAIGMLT